MTPVGDADLLLTRHRSRKSARLIKASRPSPEQAPIAALAPVERLRVRVAEGAGGASEPRGSVLSVVVVAAGVPLAVVRIELVGVDGTVVDTLDVSADVAVCAGSCSLLFWLVAPSGRVESAEQE